jgi:hypothetical protein
VRHEALATFPDAIHEPDSLEVLDLLPFEGWSPSEMAVDLAFTSDAHSLSRFDSPLGVGVKEARLLNQAPWVRSVGSLDFKIATEGWKFPAPPPELDRPPVRKAVAEKPAGREVVEVPTLPDAEREAAKKAPIRTKPTSDTVLVKDRLLYLLQPPLDGLFDGRSLEVPFQPFPYQLEGIAFLMPRHSALLADEMGLGKTAQSILALSPGHHPHRLAGRSETLDPQLDP